MEDKTYNEQINEVITNMENDTKELFEEVAKEGTVEDSPYDDRFSDVFDEMYKKLKYFLITISYEEQEVLFVRDGQMYAFTLSVGQGSRLELAMVENPNEFIDETIKLFNSVKETHKKNIDKLQKDIEKLTENSELYEELRKEIKENTSDK